MKQLKIFSPGIFLLFAVLFIYTSCGKEEITTEEIATEEAVQYPEDARIVESLEEWEELSALDGEGPTERYFMPLDFSFDDWRNAENKDEINANLHEHSRVYNYLYQHNLVTKIKRHFGKGTLLSEDSVARFLDKTQQLALQQSVYDPTATTVESRDQCSNWVRVSCNTNICSIPFCFPAKISAYREYERYCSGSHSCYIERGSNGCSSQYPGPCGC